MSLIYTNQAPRRRTDTFLAWSYGSGANTGSSYASVLRRARAYAHLAVSQCGGPAPVVTIGRIVAVDIKTRCAVIDTSFYSDEAQIPGPPV